MTRRATHSAGGRDNSRMPAGASYTVAGKFYGQQPYGLLVVVVGTIQTMAIAIDIAAKTGLQKRQL